MDQDVLVDDRIDGGRGLIGALIRDGFDVTIAFWVKTEEEGLWYLYLGSMSLGSMTLAEAYRKVYAALDRVAPGKIRLSEVKLVDPTNPIASAAFELRSGLPGLAKFFRHRRLGSLSVEEAYIYPDITNEVSRNEIVQTVANLINRTGVLSPSLFTLRDGTQIQAIPLSIRMVTPGKVEVVLRDILTDTDRSVSADDVVGIQGPNPPVVSRMLD